MIFSGGNTTIEALVKMFGDASEKQQQREESVVDDNGRRVAENVAG